MNENRRQFVLRGLGTVIGIPALESLNPTKLYGQSSAGARRILFVYLPNGANFQAPGVIDSVNAGTLKDYLTLVTGLKVTGGSAPRAGDHARAAGSYLTAATPAFPGPGVQRSIDLQIADQVGAQSRIANLVLGTEYGGGSDAGYAPAYNGNISWASASSPAAKVVDPLSLFNQLTQAGTAGQRLAQESQRFEKGKSVLDFVKSESKDLRKKLADGDQKKLDEYLDSLRELEKRLYPQNATSTAGGNTKDPANSSGKSGTNTDKPTSGNTVNAPSIIEKTEGCPANPSRPSFSGTYDQRVSLMYDLIYQAFSCGQTQVASFMLANEASNVNCAFAGVEGGHHEISHDGSAEGKNKIARIATWHVGQIARLAERLRKTPESGANMLDFTLISLGSGIADGARHNHDNLPFFILGKGGSRVPGGRTINAQGSDLGDAWITMSAAMGLSLSSFGNGRRSLSLS